MTTFLNDSTVQEVHDAVNVVKLLGDVSSDESSDPKLVNTTVALSEVLDCLEGLPTEPPSLYVDLEGDNLSRHGTISILQLYILPTGRTYLIDVHTLQEKCFSTSGRNGSTLRAVLESSIIPKVFFDVRNDSDALYSHYRINLSGVQDLQLMELATRNYPKRYITGLSKCIEKDAPLSYSERRDWIRTKEKGVRLFAPERGGSYKIFNERPLPQDIISYCAQDVYILPRLWDYYNRKLSNAWRVKVLLASKDRVILSQSATFNGRGRHMALAPVGWS